MFEFCMVPRAEPFLEANVTDWCVLGKSSELRLIDNGDASIFINPPGSDNTFLKYTKVGMEQNMSRYEHSTSMYADIVLRRAHLITARVELNVRQSTIHNSRRLEWSLESAGVIHTSSHLERERVRASCFRPTLMAALRSRGYANCDTRIVLVRSNNGAIIRDCELLWVPSRRRRFTREQLYSTRTQLYRRRRRMAL